MARFFQTAPTQFVEDFIYQPPWQLIQSIGARKQQEYNNALTEVNLLRDLPIQYINTEANKQTADNIKQSINKEVDDITSLIKSDGLNVNSYRPRIEKLTRDLKNNVTSGDIFKLATDYNNLQNNIKQNEERMKKDPARYTAGMNSFMKKFLDAGGDSLKTGYKGQLITEDLDWDKIIDSAEKLKPSIVKKETSTPSGKGYIVDVEGEEKVLNDKELKAFMISKVLNPTSIASLRQSQDFGLGQYFVGDTNNLDYDAPGFRAFDLSSAALQYIEKSSSTKYSPDSYQIHKENQANNNYWKNKEFEQKEKEIKQKDMWETTKLAYDPDVAPELKQAAQARLSAYYGLNDNINIKNKDYGSIGDVLQNLNSPTNKALALNYFKQKAQDANRTNSQGDYFMYKNLESAVRNGKIKDLKSFTTEANKLGEQGLKLGYNMKQESEENPVWGNIKNIFGAGLRGVKEFTPFLSDGLPLDRASAFTKAKKYYDNNSYKTQKNFTGFIINDSKKSFGEGGNYNNRNANLSVEYIAPEKSINILNNFNNPNYRNNFTFYKEGSNKSLSSDEANEIENFSKYGVAAASPYGDNTNVLVNKNGEKYVAVINNSSLESNSLQQLANYNNYKFLPINSPIRNNINNSVANFFQTQALNVASKNPNETTIFLENPFGKESIKFNKKTGTASIIDNYGNTQELSDITQLATTILNLNK